MSYYLLPLFAIFSFASASQAQAVTDMTGVAPSKTTAEIPRDAKNIRLSSPFYAPYIIGKSPLTAQDFQGGYPAELKMVSGIGFTLSFDSKTFQVKPGTVGPDNGFGGASVPSVERPSVILFVPAPAEVVKRVLTGKVSLGQVVSISTAPHTIFQDRRVDRCQVGAYSLRTNLGCYSVVSPDDGFGGTVEIFERISTPSLEVDANLK